jgi:hypothetical protein
MRYVPSPLSSMSKTFGTFVQALPEAAAKYGDKMMSLSYYFFEDKEGKLIESIRQICKIVAPDTILAELDDVYFTIKEGFSQLFSFSSFAFAPVFRLFLKTRQDSIAQDKRKHTILSFSALLTSGRLKIDAAKSVAPQNPRVFGMEHST